MPSLQIPPFNYAEYVPTYETLQTYGLWAFEMGSKVLLEALKVAAVVIFLNIFCITILTSDYLQAVAISPLDEEVFFRGIIQNGIHLLQKGLGPFFYTESGAEDETREKMLRVALSATIFGFAHLFNYPPSWPQVVMSIWEGIEHGVMMEKTESLALPILDHGLHNAFTEFMYRERKIGIVPIFFAYKIYNCFSVLSGDLTLSGQILQKIEHLFFTPIYNPLRGRFI